MHHTRGFDDVWVAVTRFFCLASPRLASLSAFGIGIGLGLGLEGGWLFLGERATRPLRVNAARRTLYAARRTAAITPSKAAQQES